MKRRGDSCLNTHPPTRTKSIITMFGVLVVCIGSKPINHTRLYLLPVAISITHTYDIQCTLYAMQIILLYIIQRTSCTLYSVHIVHYTMYKLWYCTLYGVLCCIVAKIIKYVVDMPECVHVGIANDDIWYIL